jgi:hypothetical protein
VGRCLCIISIPSFPVETLCAGWKMPIYIISIPSFPVETYAGWKLPMYNQYAECSDGNIMCRLEDACVYSVYRVF